MAVTRPATQEASHRFPQFLPDGRHFLYYIYSTNTTTGGSGVYVSQLDKSDARRLLDADTAAVYVSSGYLLFERQGKLLAQQFDSTALTVTGSAFLVAEDVAVDATGTLAALSVSAAGPILYRGASSTAHRQFVWFDRAGTPVATVGDPDAVDSINPSLSPDGHRVALRRTVEGNQDIWLIETARGALSRLTTDVAGEFAAVWSPDGRRIVFNANRGLAYDLYETAAAGGGRDTLLVASSELKTPVDWSPDGQFLLYRSLGIKTAWDLWALPMSGERRPVPLLQTTFDERDA
jgi:dipeptidyl aminopeptidase/acylaminoacyl peptidase